MTYQWRKLSSTDVWVYEPEIGLSEGGYVGIVYHPENFESNQYLWEVRKHGTSYPLYEGVEETSMGAKRAVEGEIQFKVD